MAVSEGVRDCRHGTKDCYSPLLNHFSKILSYENNHASGTI